MRKIVYFIETEKEISGVQTIIPDILEKAYDKLDADIYYVNLSHSSKFDDGASKTATDETAYKEAADDVAIEPCSDDVKVCGTKENGCINESAEKEVDVYTPLNERNEGPLKFIDVKKCDFSEFKDATFIVPINYLFFLLSYIEEYKEAKICPYIYDSQCVASFFKQMKKPNIEQVADMLNSTNSCMFINDYNASGWDYGLEQYGDCVIPASADLCTALDNKKDFNPELINIAWIGAVSSTALGCIMRICDDLYNMYITNDESVENYTHKIDFHVIGVGGVMGQINFKKYCPLIRFVFPGDLKGEDLDKYVCSNIDLAAGYNMNAVKGALCGIPTIIPAINDDPVLAKRTYVYFNDAKGCVLCWKKHELRILDYTDYTMKDVIKRLQSEEMRRNDGDYCYEHAVNNYSYKKNATKIIERINESTLTVGQLIQNDSVDGVLRQLDDFRASSEKNANASYYDYFNRNR